MPKLTISDLIKEIDKLGTVQIYDYVSGRGNIQVTDTKLPEGPIGFKRGGLKKSLVGVDRDTISTNKLGIAASVFSAKPNYPIHFDRLFGAGGNERSALETLLAYTPHFFMCWPQKINPYTGEIQNGQKHIMWCPDDTHDIGKTQTKIYDGVISEFEVESRFDNIDDTELLPTDQFDTIEAKKTHTQIQVALVEIGRSFRLKTWIAAGDHSFTVGDTTLGKLDGVIHSLDEITLLHKTSIKQAARFVDCIWFTDDGDFIPAVIEIEHSTGVTSGLDRMLKFKATLGSIQTVFTVVAPDKFRTKVVSEANNAIFRELDTRYLSYSTIRMLYGLIQKYSLSNYVDHNFIYPFMEKIVES